jgi:hypothetical protein
MLFSSSVLFGFSEEPWWKARLSQKDIASNHHLLYARDTIGMSINSKSLPHPPEGQIYPLPCCLRLLGYGMLKIVLTVSRHVQHAAMFGR